MVWYKTGNLLKQGIFQHALSCCSAKDDLSNWILNGGRFSQCEIVVLLKDDYIQQLIWIWFHFGVHIGHGLLICLEFWFPPPLCVCGSPPYTLQVSSGFSDFLPNPKTISSKLIGTSKLSIMCELVCVCVCEFVPCNGLCPLLWAQQCSLLCAKEVQTDLTSGCVIGMQLLMPGTGIGIFRREVGLCEKKAPSLTLVVMVALGVWGCICLFCYFVEMSVNIVSFSPTKCCLQFCPFLALTIYLSLDFTPGVWLTRSGWTILARLGRIGAPPTPVSLSLSVVHLCRMFGSNVISV